AGGGGVCVSPLAGAPPARGGEPIATAAITPAGLLRIGITDRRDGVELDHELRVAQRFDALLPVPGGGCARRSGVGLAGQLAACSGNEAAPKESLGAVLDALGGWERVAV